MLKQLETPEVTMNKIAQDAIDEYPDDLDRATEQMVTNIVDREELYTKLVTEACKAYLSNLMHQRRTQIWKQEYVRPSEKANAKSIKSAISNNYKRLMDFPLKSGLPLGSATYDQVAAAAEDYIKRGKTCIERGNFLTMVSKNIKRNKTVGECLTEQELQEFKKQAVK